MNKLTALIEVAKAATSPYADDWESKQALLKFDRAANPATILELCALLEKAEEALEKNFEFLGTPVEGRKVMPWTDTYDALTAIKQWRQP